MNDQQIAMVIMGVALLSLMVAVVVVGFSNPKIVTDKDRPPRKPADPKLVEQAEAHINSRFGLD